MVRLDPQKLCPSRLSETGLFTNKYEWRYRCER